MAGLFRDDVLGPVDRDGHRRRQAGARWAAATADVEADRAGVAIVIPAGFTSAVTTGRPAEMRIIAGGNLTAREVARRRRHALRLRYRRRPAGGADDRGGWRPGRRGNGRGRRPGRPRASPITVADIAADKRQASMATFYGAAMAIMFVFFATQYGDARAARRATRRDAQPADRGADPARGHHPRRRRSPGWSWASSRCR